MSSATRIAKRKALKMSRRYMPMPETIQVMNQAGEMVDFTYAEFVKDVLLKDIRWAVSRDDFREADEVEDEIEDKKVGDILSHREAVWKKMRDRSLKPMFGAEKAGYHPNIRPAMVYVDAIEEATKDKPNGVKPAKKRATAKKPSKRK